jgi:hypothetical protein
MPRIFISYRRADSDAIAGRIRDRLVDHFGEQSVFMDIDSIPFGADFRTHIKEMLSHNDILVSIIGPQWLGSENDGHLRIADETDPIRVELEIALQTGSAVIPVLVGGAKMPKPSELPNTLKDFSYRNAAEVDAGRDFHHHVQRLIRSMEILLARRSDSVAGLKKEDTARSDVGTETASREAASTPESDTASLAKLSDAPAVVATTVHDASPADKPAPRQRRLWLIGLPAVCVVLGIGTAAWLYLRVWQPGATKVAPPSIATPAPKPTPPPRMAGEASAGCNSEGSATFSDDFQLEDPAWLALRRDANTVYYADGQLALNGSEGKYALVLYRPLHFKNFAICATLKSPSQLGVPDGGAMGGMAFWAEDTANFYVAAVYTNGTYSIYRLVDNAWHQITARTGFEGIKSGASATNEVRVTASGNTATLYINGAKVQEFRGQPPKNPGMIGLYGGSNSNERNEWRVQNFAITDLDLPKQQARAKAPAPQIELGCKPVRPAAFQDDFNSHDPGWGSIEEGVVFYSDGELVLKPRVNTSLRRLYSSLIFKNATVCARVKSSLQSPNNSITNGGLAFWSINNSNHYIASVYPDGKFSIYRNFNSQWAALIPATKSEYVRAEPLAINEIMITFNGDAAILYLNGHNVYQIRGQPPQKGGSIGVFAATGDAESDWHFLDVVVVDNE